jgi:hypothetical protein
LIFASPTFPFILACQPQIEHAIYVKAVNKSSDIISKLHAVKSTTRIIRATGGKNLSPEVSTSHWRFYLYSISHYFLLASSSVGPNV